MAANETDTKKPLFKRWWFWLIIVIIAFVAFGAAGSGGSSSDASSPAGEAPKVEEKPKYEISDEELVDKGYGIYYVTGTLTNNSGKDRSYVQVEYVLKDESGAQIGTGFANTSNLAKDGVWKYEALCSVSGDAVPATFEVAEVTGF